MRQPLQIVVQALARGRIQRGETLAVSVGPPRLPQLKTTVTLPMQNPIALVTLRLPAPGSR